MANEKNEKQVLATKFWVGVAVAVIGLGLLFWGLVIPPSGEIHSSVLVAFGEVATFAAGIIGVDYHYSFREYETRMNKQ